MLRYIRVHISLECADVRFNHHARSALKPEFSQIGVRQCELRLVEWRRSSIRLGNALADRTTLQASVRWPIRDSSLFLVQADRLPQASNRPCKRWIFSSGSRSSPTTVSISIPSMSLGLPFYGQPGEHPARCILFP